MDAVIELDNDLKQDVEKGKHIQQSLEEYGNKMTIQDAGSPAGFGKEPLFTLRAKEEFTTLGLNRKDGLASFQQYTPNKVELQAPDSIQATTLIRPRHNSWLCLMINSSESLAYRPSCSPIGD